MKSRILYTAITAAAAISFAATIPAMAQTGTATTARPNAAAREQMMQQREQNMMGRGSTEITARIDSLNKVLARIQGMKNLSDSQKASFAASVNSQIASLTTLQTKLQTDNSTTSLRADLKTIAPDYRIYMLVQPQLALLSAVDRVNTVVASLQAIAVKVQARVAASSTTSVDLSDFNAKLADATAQASAAQTEIVGLTPDQGNTTVMQSNTAALKDARTKIQAATKDLEAARQDIRTIVQSLVKNKPATTN